MIILFIKDNGMAQYVKVMEYKSGKMVKDMKVCGWMINLNLKVFFILLMMMYMKDNFAMDNIMEKEHSNTKMVKYSLEHSIMD